MGSESFISVLSAFIRHPFVETFTWLYMAMQAVLVYIFSPIPPPPTDQNPNLPRKRVAVIGAGLTGVSSAAHCVGNGFDVQLFESRPKEQGLGGIWSVSSTFCFEVKYLLINTFYRESIPPPHYKSTVSCTVSILRSSSTAHIPRNNRSKSKSSMFGRDMIWKDALPSRLK